MTTILICLTVGAVLSFAMCTVLGAGYGAFRLIAWIASAPVYPHLRLQGPGTLPRVKAGSLTKEQLYERLGHLLTRNRK